MDITFGFGPFIYRVEGTLVLSPLLEPFIVENMPVAEGVSEGNEREPVMVRAVSSRPNASASVSGTGGVRLGHDIQGRELLSGPGFGAVIVPRPATIGTRAPRTATLAGRVEAWIDPAFGGPGFGLMSVLSGLVLRDAAAAGYLVLHAAGIRTDAGRSVCLIAGASGTGKSTLAKASGNAAFSYNAVLVHPKTGMCTPLPFAGQFAAANLAAANDPPISSVAPSAATCALVLRRGGEALSVSPGHAAALLGHAHFADGDPNRTSALLSALPWAMGRPIFLAEVPHVPVLENMVESLLNFVERGSASLSWEWAAQAQGETGDLAPYRSNKREPQAEPLG